MAKSKTKSKTPPSATATKEAKPEVRIVFNKEAGTSGLKEWSGFITEAYNAQLTWPTVYPLYSRLRRSMPEIVTIRQAFTSWSRSINFEVDLPDKPTDDDKKYKDFVDEVVSDMDGGATAFLDTLVNHVPFMGFGWWEVLPGKREEGWVAPNDGWKSEYDDGLTGIRRIAWRDPGTFFQWEFDDNKRVKGFWQQDYPKPKVFLPLEKSLHITFGDPNNPEGLSPLEAVWRLERLRYGFEVVMGIGFEHSAGYLSVNKTEGGVLSNEDKAAIATAAYNILSAQEGNYAAWPQGMDGKVIDIGFQSAASLLETIKHYSLMVLSVYTMQWIGLNTLTGTGALASMQDSSQLGVFTFNSMMDGFASQFDNQVGRRLWEWNKKDFPNVTKRPVIRFSHIDKEIALAEVSSFLNTLNGILPLGEEDYKAIRTRSGFLPEALPKIDPTKQDAMGKPLPLDENGKPVQPGQQQQQQKGGDEEGGGDNPFKFNEQNFADAKVIIGEAFNKVNDASLEELRGAFGRPGEVGGSSSKPHSAISKQKKSQAGDISMRSELVKKGEISDEDFEAMIKGLSFEDPYAMEYLEKNKLTRDELLDKMNKAREEAMKMTSSKDIHFKDGKYTEERAALHQSIVDDIMAGKKSQDEPVAVVTGGLPGAGKSSIMKSDKFNEFKTSAVEINSDEFKEALAKADGIETLGIHAGKYHEESRDVAAMATEQAMEKRTHVVLDTTLSRESTTIKMVDGLSKAGYKTELVYAKLPLDKSIQRASFRFLETERFVDPYNIAVYDKKPDRTLDLVKDKFDKWSVWDTDVAFGASPKMIASGGG